jgi:hypothetical protein
MASLTDVDVMEELRRLAAKTPSSDHGWTMAELAALFGLGDRRARALAARAMSAGLLALGRRWVKYINGVERWTPVYVPTMPKTLSEGWHTVADDLTEESPMAKYLTKKSSRRSGRTGSRRRAGSSRG